MKSNFKINMLRLTELALLRIKVLTVLLMKMQYFGMLCYVYWQILTDVSEEHATSKTSITISRHDVTSQRLTCSTGIHSYLFRKHFYKLLFNNSVISF
jgi:hypothetical protein